MYHPVTRTEWAQTRHWTTPSIWPFLLVMVTILCSCYSPFPRTTQAPAPATPITAAIDALTLSLPPTIDAGTPFTVTITSQPIVDSAAIALYLFNTDGTRRYSSMLHNGQAAITITGSVTEIAGEVEVVARSGAIAGSRTLTIIPGEPVEPVLALVGPRSITADGEHWTMVTALPHDRFGNAVAEATPVTVRVLHPATAATATATLSESIEILNAQSKYLLAWIRVFSHTVAGRMEMAVTSGSAHSAERTVIAVPGPPAPFGLTHEPIQRVADGRHLVTIHTDRLADHFGNILLDGTAVTFIITDPDGTTRTLPVQSIDGKATVQLQSPAIPGPIQVQALVHNTTSSSLTLDFAAGIGTAPFAVRAFPDDDVLTLVAGPLLGPLEQYVPDGSDVRFELRPEGSEEVAVAVIAPASAGFATAVIRTSTVPTGRYDIIVSAGVGQGKTTVIVH